MFSSGVRLLDISKIFLFFWGNFDLGLSLLLDMQHVLEPLLHSEILS
jgi:hypothetical protein